MLTSVELSDLWWKHAAALLLVARGHCGQIAAGAAEDCVQEAFIALAKQDPPPQSSVSWLMTCVRNAAIDVVRTQKRRKAREQAVARERQPWLQPIDSIETGGFSNEHIESALRSLDDLTRDIVVAHLWNEMAFRQIAEAFNLSSATAHRRYESGLARLRSLMLANSTCEPDIVSTGI